MVHKNFLTAILLIAGFVGCGQKDNTKEEEDEASVSIVLPAEVAEVRTETLQTIDFEHEIVSTGRISTQEVAELRFANASPGDVPVKIFVQSGDHVKAGDAIAMLDTFLLSNSHKQAADNLEKANLDLQDVLIRQGYSLNNPASIPEEVLKLASIRSGYNTTKNQYELTKYHLDNATLRTPVAGTVINLFSKPYSSIDASAPFCTIINDARLEVDFTVLENELPLINKGDRVRIQSYASPDIESTGSIAGINPSVDKEGTVRIKAYVQAQSKIFNGMNVRISVFRSLGKQWAVPKAAVVLRTGKQVVFAFKNGKAAWNYVTTGFENSTHYTITSETLQEGDEIIISGNEHLADGTNVTK